MLSLFFTKTFCRCRRAYLKRTSATVPQPRDLFHKPSPVDFQVCFLSVCLKLKNLVSKVWPKCQKDADKQESIFFLFLVLGVWKEKVRMQITCLFYFLWNNCHLSTWSIGENTVSPCSPCKPYAITRIVLSVSFSAQ